MDKFATLEPKRLYASSGTSTGSRFPYLGSTSAKLPVITVPVIGRLPTDLHRLILNYVAIHDIPAYARSSRALNNLVKDGQYWDTRWSALGVEKHRLESVLDDLEGVKQGRAGAAKADQPPMLAVSNDLDDFGDFAASNSNAFGDFGDFVGSSPAPAAKPMTAFSVFNATAAPSRKHLYIRAHSLLKPLAAAIGSNPPHLVLSALSEFFAPTSPSKGSVFPSSNATSGITFKQTSQTLHILALFLSPSIQPLKTWQTLYSALRAAMDRFDANMLAAFDVADGKADEDGMRDAAEASWEVWEASNPQGRSPADWEMGKVWAEKREIFYEQGRWDPLENFTKDNALDFDAMDAFMNFVLQALDEHGSRAVRVFPPPSQVLISFAERISHEVVGEYITTLLSRAREVGATGNDPVIFLQATAASFNEAWRMVDTIMSAAETQGKSSSATKANGAKPTHKPTESKANIKSEKETDDEGPVVQRIKAEDVVYQMFESNMDEYLDEEIELVKRALDAIGKGWERELSSSGFPFSPTSPTSQPQSLSAPLTSAPAQSQPRFLSSQNPAQVKRNVLASFTSVLLLPVTIVPRAVGTVGGAIGSVVGAGAMGVSMLNPAKWGGAQWQGSGNNRGTWEERVSKTGWGAGAVNGNGNGSSTHKEEASTVFEVGEEEDEEEKEDTPTKVNDEWTASEEKDPWGEDDTAEKKRASIPSLQLSGPDIAQASAPAPSVPTPSTGIPTPSSIGTPSLEKLDLLLSLDVALEMIHADRKSLKRIETFSGYPGHYGHRVRDSIEELFILVLDALGEGHLRKGFGSATEQMKAYKPADHEVTTSVAPLMQFFELVHVGDTIQSMVQVYFDKELAQYIDRTDFLNPVVREKKRFENALDDSVAGGLNAGTEVLMNQVDHIILTLTKPREYYPPEDAPLDLGPTKGCTEAIRCLEKHCKLLKGSTSKEVLEVFYQEVGIRLIAILQKHIKRQIISLNGGFQVIADLNTYHAFISSLKVPSITSDFSHLKMLGHVYVVEDAKDLAQIVRDVTRYGGAYRPEDIYEFIQRRSDWKKIEKTVDKTMYNLSFKEDCVVC